MPQNQQKNLGTRIFGKCSWFFKFFFSTFLALFWRFWVYFHLLRWNFQLFTAQLLTTYACDSRITQKNIGTSPFRRCYWLSKFHVERSNGGFWPFLGILGLFPSKDIESFTFYCIATNFICMCLRINNINLGIRPFKRCSWLTKLHKEPIFWPFFWPVFDVFVCIFIDRIFLFTA